METSPIRIHQADKEQLRKLSRELALAKGRPVTQQETLSRAVSFAMDRREDFLKDSTWKPLTPAQIHTWEEAVTKGKGWKAVPVEKIDDVVYGD